MENVRNEMIMQRTNTVRTESFIRARYDEYCDIRSEHERLVKTIREENDEIMFNKKMMRILAWKWTSIDTDLRPIDEIMKELGDFMINGYREKKNVRLDARARFLLDVCRVPAQFQRRSHLFRFACFQVSYLDCLRPFPFFWFLPFWFLHLLQDCWFLPRFDVSPPRIANIFLFQLTSFIHL